MRYFAGLDVSLEETAICIVDEAGRIMREARVASESDALVAFFDALGMAMELVGLEACSLTAVAGSCHLRPLPVPTSTTELRPLRLAQGGPWW